MIMERPGPRKDSVPGNWAAHEGSRKSLDHRGHRVHEGKSEILSDPLWVIIP